MAKILLINRDDIMAYTSVNGNIDDTKIYPHIYNAQKKVLQYIIGTDLLEKLEADVAGGGATGNYATLLDDYVTPCLSFYAMADFIGFHAYEIANGGIYKHTSEASITPEKLEIDSLIQKYKDNADFWKRRLKDYLCANSTFFPEYSSNTNNDMSPRDTKIRNGWVI